MDIEKLIEQVNRYFEGETLPRGTALDAAAALSTLRAENENLRGELENEHAHRLHAEQHGDAFLEDCKRLNTELEQLKEKNAGLALALLTECAPNPDCLGDDEWKAIRAELERVKRERDAALEDVAAIIGDVEEIRRGYDVDNADADGAFAELCETYCANKGRSCYAECEKYHCKNFKWRGQKED